MNGSYTNTLIQRTAVSHHTKGHAVPFVVWPEDIHNLGPLALPYLPAGAPDWKLLSTDRVTSTLGIPRQDIVSQAHFKSGLEVGRGYAIIASGPDYQVIGKFGPC